MPDVRQMVDCGRTGAFAWAIAILGVLAVYQAYLTCNHPSPFDLGLGLFDALIVVMIWYEYLRLRRTPVPRVGQPGNVGQQG